MSKQLTPGQQLLEKVKLLIRREYSGKLEKLAKLEHEQWVKWSQSIAEEEHISPERLERWKKLWVPYEQLDDKDKESGRVRASDILDAVTLMSEQQAEKVAHATIDEIVTDFQERFDRWVKSYEQRHHVTS